MPLFPTSVAYTPTVHDWLRGFFLHVVTGFIATGAHYTLMWLLLLGGIPAIPASALGFLAGGVSRFLLSYLHVFSPTVGVHIAMIRFVGAIALQMGANTLLLAGLLAVGWTVWIAQIATTALLTVLNYVAYRVWVFR